MKSPIKIALVEVFGLTAYITLFALLSQLTSSWIQPANISPIVSVIFFLLVFVFSTLISGSLILGYPAKLFFEGKKKEAFSVLLWSAVWMIIFIIVALLLLLILK